MVSVPAPYIFQDQGIYEEICRSPFLCRSCGDIYPARETDTLGISSRDLQKEIEALGKKCSYFPSFEEIEKFLLENCTAGDLLITMGAGDIGNIGDHLLKQ